MASSWDHLSQSSSSSSQSTATDWRSTEAAGNQRRQLTATKTTEQLRQLRRAAAADAAPSKPPAEAGAPSWESRARDWLEALSSVDDGGVGTGVVSDEAFDDGAVADVNVAAAVADGAVDALFFRSAFPAPIGRYSRGHCQNGGS